MDILVSNAGICVLEDFMDISSDSFDEVIAINTRAPLLVSQVRCIARMVDKSKPCCPHEDGQGISTKYVARVEQVVQVRVVFSGLKVEYSVRRQARIPENNAAAEDVGVGLPTHPAVSASRTAYHLFHTPPQFVLFSD